MATRAIQTEYCRLKGPGLSYQALRKMKWGSFAIRAATWHIKVGMPFNRNSTDHSIYVVLETK
jgi:hypothetical protein